MIFLFSCFFPHFLGIYFQDALDGEDNTEFVAQSLIPTCYISNSYSLYILDERLIYMLNLLQSTDPVQLFQSSQC